MTFYVYMLANYSDGPIYVGHIDEIARRISQHREEVFEGFTKRYNIKRLVWMEPHETRESAFKRERAIKRWRREWKNNLIRQSNPDWEDLFYTLNGGTYQDPGKVQMELPGRADF